MCKLYRAHLTLLIAGAFACLAGAAAQPAAAAWRQSDKEMVNDVATGLFDAAKPPANCDWPPPIEFIDNDTPQASCGNVSRVEGHITPRVRVYRGLMDQVVQGHPDRLAFVLGHEIAHALKGHIVHKADDPARQSEFIRAVLTREQEYEADKLGLELAMAAGYSFEKCLEGMKVFVEGKYEYPGITLDADHPSWKERLAQVDKSHAHFWRSMDAFQSGVRQLHFEQFSSAAACFDRVIKEFPECPEAWANLGYARLMQYCDGLTTEDLRGLGISQMIVGGFYQRPKWLLEQENRGADPKAWGEATRALSRALELDKGLTLARANLGIAYLVRPDSEGGKDPVTAKAHLAEAAKAIASDRVMAPSMAAAILINNGVAEIAGGESESAAANFERVAQLIGNDTAPRLVAVSAIASAMHYNRAMLLARSTTRPNREKAIKGFENYFRTASPNSAWWPLAYERYAKLCKDLGVKAKEQAELVTRAVEIKRPVGSVTLASGVIIDLGLPMTELESTMKGPGLRAPVYRGLKLMRSIYPDQGVRFTGIDRVMAISLYGPKAPAVMVRGAEIGSEQKPLRIGMTVAELEKVIGRHLADKEPVTDGGVDLYVYRDLQLAVRIEEGRITEIVVAMVPEGQREEKDTKP